MSCTRCFRWFAGAIPRIRRSTEETYWKFPVAEWDTFPHFAFQESTEQNLRAMFPYVPCVRSFRKSWAVNCTGTSGCSLRFSMRTILLLLASLTIWPGATYGQSSAGRAPSLDAYWGYSYVNQNGSSANQTSLNGVDSGMSAEFRPYFGLRADVGYARAANVNGSPRHADLLTLLAGPVVSSGRKRGNNYYVHALLGAARTTGATPTSTGFITGYATEMAWLVGTGAQHRISSSLAVRIGFDFVRTSYFNEAARLQPQNNFRATVSFVHQFGRGTER